MSTSSEPTETADDDPDPSEEPGAWIRANEEWLREKANSDSHIDWIAERLLYSEGLEP